MEKEIDKEALILDALEEVYLETGNILIKSVAQKAGLSRMTVNRLFGSKECLIERYKEVRGFDIPGIDAVPTVPVRMRILKAAGKCFGKSGFQGATIEEIAKIAKVGTATVYRSFKDKENLIKAYVEEYSRSQIRQELKLGPDFRTNLIQFAIYIFDMIEENTDLFKIALIETSNNPELMEKLGDSPNRTLYMISDYFIKSGCVNNDTQRSQDFAMAFMGMLMSFGFIYPVSYNIPIGNKEERARLIVDIFLKGIDGF